MEKVCNKCKSSILLTNFTKSKNSKDGYRNTCKICTNLIKNNEKYKSYQKDYRLVNRDIKLNYMSEYNSKPEVKEKIKEWFFNNKEHVNKLKRINRRNIPHIIAWRNLLTHSLERLGQQKEGHTIDLLGYSAIDLKQHITSLFTEGMTWDNHGEWHIDHIKPVSSFDKKTSAYVFNSLTNLQPLWATTRVINGIVYEGNLNKNNRQIN